MSTLLSVGPSNARLEDNETDGPRREKVVDSFGCLRCSRESPVRTIKMEDGHFFLICQWCSAEHEYVLVHRAKNRPTDVEIVSVRPEVGSAA